VDHMGILNAQSKDLARTNSECQIVQ
jgi:hypothetical protein